MANLRTPFYTIAIVMLIVSIIMLLISCFLRGHLHKRKWMTIIIICDICMLIALRLGWSLGVMFIEKSGGDGNPVETIIGLIANGIMIVATVISACGNSKYLRGS